MELEDQQRFEIDINFWDDDATLRCQKCGAELAILVSETLAELNQRAAEHAEVCP